MSYTDRIALLVEVGEAAIRWRARRQDAIAVTSGKTFTALGKAEADLARLAGEYQTRYPDRRDADGDGFVIRLYGCPAKPGAPTS
jgi:hypothetical protein